MSEKEGVKELKEVIELVTTCVKIGLDVGKDGKLTPEDIGFFLALVPKIEPAFSAIGKVPAELADLSQEEGLELVTAIGAALSLENDKAKALVEKSLKVAVSVYDLIKTITV